MYVYTSCTSSLRDSQRLANMEATILHIYLDYFKVFPPYQKYRAYIDQVSTAKYNKYIYLLNLKITILPST